MNYYSIAETGEHKDIGYLTAKEAHIMNELGLNLMINENPNSFRDEMVRLGLLSTAVLKDISKYE